MLRDCRAQNLLDFSALRLSVDLVDETEGLRYFPDLLGNFALAVGKEPEAVDTELEVVA